MDALFAGIDLGTSGCRIMLIDQAKTIQANAQIRYAADQPQTPQLWWQSVKQLLAGLPKPVKNCLQAIAVDGTSGTLLLTDDMGKPVSSVLMYHDMRATKEAQLISQLMDKNSGAQGVASSLARLLWLLKNEKPAKASHALHQADFILGKLANHFGLSDQNNSLKLGYDALNAGWPDQISQLGFDLSLLPDVVPAGRCLQSMDKQLARELGLSNHVQLVSGTTDSIAAFIASGANRVGEAVTSLGSTLVLKLISDKPVFAPEYGVYSHKLGDYWLVGGASNSGGKVLSHYFSVEQMDQMSTQLKPGQSTALDYYPLLKQGERFPFADALKQPELSPRPDSDVVFFQAMLEGMAGIEARGYQRLAGLGAPALISVRSVGGGSYNKAWTQIRKNHLNVDMVKPAQTEAAYGSALLALQGLIND